MTSKLLASALLLFAVGALSAADVLLIKYNQQSKELTVRECDEERTYKVTETTKFFAVNSTTGVTKEMTYEMALKGLINAKAEGKLMFQITVEDSNVIEARFLGREKK